MTVRVRGVVLPERLERTFWIDGGLLREDGPAGAETVVEGGWLLPGLVDVHTHPGAITPSDPFDDELLRGDLADHARAGVLAVRAPGSAARIPDWVHDEPGLPRISSAGPWLAAPGLFLANGGRHVSLDELPGAAVEEATASGGWCKITGDWNHDDPPVPLDVLRAATAAVHAADGKVAVHCQTADGCRNAVLAGVDSLEHGMHLDPALLDTMAARGTALVPTIASLMADVDYVRTRPPGPRRDWYLDGCAGLGPIARAAHEAGVTVLAGTDSRPLGTVAAEVEHLLEAGLPAEAALGAASWTARAWLGLPGLADGAPADLVVYDADPTADPAVLRRPARVILRGRVLR